MTKFLLTATLMALTTMAFGQRTIVNWEDVRPVPDTVQWFGEDGSDTRARFQVIENPDKSGINVSDSVGEFLEAPGGEPWFGMFFDLTDDIDLTAGQTVLCTKVWMPNTLGYVLKVEFFDGNSSTFAYEPASITNTVTNGWEEICFDYAGTDAEGVSVNRMVVFFNIGATSTSDNIYYFDEMTQPNAVSIDPDAGYEIAVFPNPVQDRLMINTNVDIYGFQLRDLSGRVVAQQNGFNEKRLEVSGLAAGVYLLTIQDRKMQPLATTKIVKQ